MRKALYPTAESRSKPAYSHRRWSASRYLGCPHTTMTPEALSRPLYTAPPVRARVRACPSSYPAHLDPVLVPRRRPNSLHAPHAASSWSNIVHRRNANHAYSSQLRLGADATPPLLIYNALPTPIRFLLIHLRNLYTTLFLFLSASPLSLYTDRALFACGTPLFLSTLRTPDSALCNHGYLHRIVSLICLLFELRASKFTCFVRPRAQRSGGSNIHDQDADMACLLASRYLQALYS
ncbi:hypothetical protein C8R43DRAFT_441096 [Mycena crocata]|nr:hypothetical protein C8R43DRAFT_441096 [Mycena crocata]